MAQTHLFKLKLYHQEHFLSILKERNIKVVHSSYKMDGKGKNQETNENHKRVMKGI